MATLGSIIEIDLSPKPTVQKYSASFEPRRNHSELGVPQPMKVRGGWYSTVKLTIEWLVALFLFVITSPLLLTLAALVKWGSQGPAFYAQTRLGKNGKPYCIYKLRTMVHNAEGRTGPVWAAKNDRRITPIGRFLRDTHLDELPQLWNVIRGEMGLIGPRPERPEIAANITSRVPQFRHRLRVRPGVTGLAQMLLPADDPNDTEYQGLRKKLAHDLYYISNMSLLLDLRIAISTPCYFMAAAIDAVRGQALKSCRIAVEEREPALLCEQAA